MFYAQNNLEQHWLKPNSLIFRIFNLFKVGKIGVNQLLKKYRTLQILGVLQNEIQQQFLLTELVVASIVLLSLCTTIVTKLGISGIVAVVCIIIVVDCLSILTVLLGGMAMVHSTSVKGTQQLMALLALEKANFKTRRMIYKSLVSIKMRFGSINFVDSLTPLKCIDYANSLTVQLLLLSI